MVKNQCLPQLQRRWEAQKCSSAFAESSRMFICCLDQKSALHKLKKHPKVSFESTFEQRISSLHSNLIHKCKFLCKTKNVGEFHFFVVLIFSRFN